MKMQTLAHRRASHVAARIYLVFYDLSSRVSKKGDLLKAGQSEYDCRYSKMHGMPVTGGRGFGSLKPLWYKGVPP
jgi:hypothetical protein